LTARRKRKESKLARSRMWGKRKRKGKGKETKGGKN